MLACRDENGLDRSGYWPFHILIHIFLSDSEWIGYYTDSDANTDFFRCRKWYGFGADWIIYAYLLFFMMRNNSLAKVIKRQYNSK